MILYLIIGYIIFLIFFALYSIAAIYHLVRFGFAGDLTKPAIVIYVVLAAATIVLTLIYLIGAGLVSPVQG